MESNATRTVPCPTCQRPAVFAPSNRWRPFCSERCRSADLGAWASDRYRLPVQDSASDADEQAPN
jgi:endogenous inhibitor of DNA gyrase (YacG/DUF329 family)